MDEQEPNAVTLWKDSVEYVICSPETADDWRKVGYIYEKCPIIPDTNATPVPGKLVPVKPKKVQ